MYYRYQPYPYHRRYQNFNPYYYPRYYNPYYNYQQNIIDSQIAEVDQSIINYGDMTDVIQNADVYQSMSPEPETTVATVTEAHSQITVTGESPQPNQSFISIP